MTIIEKARISAPKEKLALINERTILSENLLPFYSGLKDINADTVQRKDLTNEVRVRTERIATITKLIPEYNTYIAKLNPLNVEVVYRNLANATPMELGEFGSDFTSFFSFKFVFIGQTKIVLSEAITGNMLAWADYFPEGHLVMGVYPEGDPRKEIFTDAGDSVDYNGNIINLHNLRQNQEYNIMIARI
jgi:hypothetical protein